MGVLGTLNDIKQGLTVIYNGEPHKVLVAKFVRMQQRKPVMQTKMRNLVNGKTIEYNFKAGERVETGDVERKTVNFLYAAGNEFVFMDNQSYEQISLTKEKVGDQAHFLKEGMEVDLMSFNDVIIDLELPAKVEVKVTAAADTVKGNSAQGNITKMVEIETGFQVAVPMFIKEGDIIRLNTDSGEYVDRVSE